MDTDDFVLVEKELTEKIIGACFEVANELGSGFLECVYRKALLLTLEEVGLKAKVQVPLTVSYRGHPVGSFFADLVVEDRVVLEIKSKQHLIPEFEAQLINYLKASGIKVGLLINFGRNRVQWKRLVF
jgi:GxxExxY protein